MSYIYEKSYGSLLQETVGLHSSNFYIYQKEAGKRMDGGASWMEMWDLSNITFWPKRWQPPRSHQGWDLVIVLAVEVFQGNFKYGLSLNLQ